jgi:ferredoxin
METSVLTSKIIKENNPGLTDFGSGNLLALTSQCLRCAKKPTPCTICSDFCPVGGIETHAAGRPLIKTSCIRCGACVGSCPVNALAASTKTLQQIARLSLQASLRVDHLAISCERTTALLRLASQTDQPETAIEALRFIEEARANECLQTVPCLGMLTKELWFALLNEIGVSKLKELSVFLPTAQCLECPVNARNNIEDQFGAAIDCAERWSQRSVGLITTADGLPQIRKANVRTYLTSNFEVDRRGAFTGFLQELKQSWDDNAQMGNRAVEEVRLQRERKKSFERTRLSANIKKGKSPGRNPIAVPTRYILIEALGRNDAHATEVHVTVSTTDENLCILCGECVDVCPLHTRAIAETTPENTEPFPVDATETASTTTKNAGERRPADVKDADRNVANAVTDCHHTAPDAAANRNRTLAVDTLYCVACSACLQTCPTNACSFTEIEGQSFLLDEAPK